MDITDAELVARCRNGDREAWEIIVRQRHTRIYNLAYRFTGRIDEAEDLTQEVFLKVYRTYILTVRNQEPWKLGLSASQEIILSIITGSIRQSGRRLGR